VSHANFCNRCGLALDAPAQTTTGDSKARLQTNAAEKLPMAKKPATPINEKVSTSQAGEMISSTAGEEREQVEQGPEVKTSRGRSPLEQYLPRDLMKKLETARASGDMVGERRVVTILFCDVKGSTQAAEQLDPEEWSEIINGAFEHMIKPIFKYEGTVARLMGDGILAFFGAPLAH